MAAARCVVELPRAVWPWSTHGCCALRGCCHALRACCRTLHGWRLLLPIAVHVCHCPYMPSSDQLRNLLQCLPQWGLPCTPLPEQLPSLLNRLFCTRLAGCKLSHACHIFFAKTAFGVGKCEITHVLCDKKPYPSGHTLYSTKPSSVCWCAAALACCVIGVSPCCDVGVLLYRQLVTLGVLRQRCAASLPQQHIT